MSQSGCNEAEVDADHGAANGHGEYIIEKAGSAFHVCGVRVGIERDLGVILEVGIVGLGIEGSQTCVVGAFEIEAED